MTYAKQGRLKTEAKAKETILVHITTVPMTLGFLVGQASYMKSKGFAVHAISSPGESASTFAAQEKVSVHTAKMSRRITPLQDIGAVFSIWLILRGLRPHIVHSHTPKGGLLGMIGAWLAGTSLRIYHIHGLPMTTVSGCKRLLLRATEKLSCKLAHQVFCVSSSLEQEVIAHGICPAKKIKVLSNGSINGVDATDRFNPKNVDDETRRRIRASYGIFMNDLVVGFVGRVVRDKGIVELTHSWQRIREEYSQAHLLVVGPLESQDPLPPETMKSLHRDPRVHLVGHKNNVVPLYFAMDVFVLPSHREGFGVVLLEASAMALPVVASKIPGCVDAVRDGVTGMLVPPSNVEVLTKAVCTYLDHPELRHEHGKAGRERVLREFRPEVIWEESFQEYTRLLREMQCRETEERLRLAEFRKRLRRWIKRLMDFTGALMTLIVLAPVFVLVAIAIRLAMGSPIVFCQQRPGLRGKPFTIYKFRTMTDARDAKGNLLPDAERLTRLGRFLRSTSLDELPEIFNVLKGDMSLVGPRPLLMQYLEHYTPEQARRHEIKPGITGWAQVNGRNAITWEEKFALDVWYVDNWSLGLDLKIIALTVWEIFKREGINQPGQATVEYFQGS